MPELPEVEVVRRGLHEHVLGMRVLDVQVRHPRAVRGQDVDIATVLTGATFQAACRRGKYLWLTCADPRQQEALLIHLGMSGQILVGEPGTCTSPHLRIWTLLAGPDGRRREMAFVDQRTFGRWCYTHLVDGIPAPITHIARDVLDPEFDLDATVRQIRASRATIKSLLLNQSVVSGIGNIYADESLWAAEMTPTRRGIDARPIDVAELLRQCQQVMRRSLAAGGTSFDSLYVNVDGASGYFARSLNVYGLADHPCPRCGRPIHRVKFQNRSTHYCPTCQVR